MTPVRTSIAILTLSSVAILAGCSTSGPSRGGYYKDDGPGSNIPANIEAIPNAVPRIETHARANMRPYTVFGKTYTPISDEREYRQIGTASWYGRKFHGAKTANGETYDMYAMTAAHPTLPIPSYARVTHAVTGKSIIVRINDRGPFLSNRIIDLSYVAAAKLNLIKAGSGQVIVEAITNRDIAQGLTRIAATEPSPPPSPTIAAATPLPVPEPVNPARVVTQTTPDAMTALQAEAPQPITQESQIFLQFGAFSGAANAHSLAQKLNEEITQIESRRAHIQAANNIYRVLIGPYPDRTAAVNSAIRIRQETGSKPTVAIL